jgi:hypothetical protein
MQLEVWNSLPVRFMDSLVLRNIGALCTLLALQSEMSFVGPKLR